MQSATQTVADRPQPGLGRRVLLLSAAAFSSALSTRISDPVLPQLAKAFSITIGEAAHAVSVYALAYGCVLLIYGPLGDRYGKFRVITIATLASVVGALGSALAFNFSWLTIFRFLNGATVAALIPLSMAWIGDNVPYERRQQILAYLMSGQILGLISGQALGGLLADLAGWRSVFYFQMIAYLIVGSCLFIERKRSPDIDRNGALVVNPAPFWRQIIDIVRNRWPRQILLSVFAEGLLLFSAFAFIPSFLHHQFGLTLTMAGLSMGMFGVGGLSYTLFARNFVRRFGERGLALGGGGLLSFAFIMLILANAWQWILPAMFCAGLGYYMLHNTLQTNATQMAPQSRGTAVALFASCFFTGQAIGVWLASLSLDQFGYYPVFWVAALLLPVVGILFSMKIKNNIQSP